MKLVFKIAVDQQTRAHAMAKLLMGLQTAKTKLMGA